MFRLSVQQHLHNNNITMKYQMLSRLADVGLSAFCFRQIVFCCFLCSVFIVLLLNRPSSLNDDVSTDWPPSRTTTALVDAKIQQLERQKLLHEKCRDLKKLTKANQHQRRKVGATQVRFIIEDRHRVVYCDVPKVASTNLKRLMIILSGKVEADDLSSISQSAVHEKKEIRELYAKNLNDTIKKGLGDFTKFIFVRHPFERLVSAYRDRLVNNEIYQKTVGKEIVLKYRQNPNQLSLEMGHDVTFPEFVRFVVDEWKDAKRHLDVHWRPVVDLCHPCDMQFHFIGKFETLNQDVDLLLDKLNETDLSRIFAGQPNKPKTTSSLWKDSMKMISHQQLSDLNQMFADDFRLFGYPHYYTKRKSLR